MKTAFSSFIYSRRGIYGILHILILLMSLFLVISISILFTSYITMLMATVYFASLIFFVLEHKVNPMVTDYWSALWWAFMDVTTVGSNIYAVTPTGKILSVVLAALGMMMFPIFTVYVTSLVQQANKRKEEYYQSQQSEPADTK